MAAVMEESQVRRSGRRRIRRLEHWNFEKPEDAAADDIIYNECQLTKCSVFTPFSLSYLKAPRKTSASVKGKPKAPVSAARTADSHSGHRDSPSSSVQNGRKRKLASRGSSEVNGEASLRSRGKVMRVGGREPPGKDGAGSLPNDLSPPHLAEAGRQADTGGSKEPRRNTGRGSVSPRQAERKRTSEGRTTVNTDDGYSSLREPSCSPRVRLRRLPAGREEVQKQVTESRTAGEESNLHAITRQENASVMQSSRNITNFRESVISDSDRIGKNSYMAKLNLTQKDVTENTTALEPPSFRSVLCSTAIEGPGNDPFKVPRLPSFRKLPVSLLKVSSQFLDPSMVTIPEEQEEQLDREQQQPQRQQGQQQKRGQQKEEEHRQPAKEKQNKEQVEENQVEVENVGEQRQDKAGGGGDGDGGGGGGGAATTTPSPRQPAGPGQSAVPGVVAEPEGPGQQGQEDVQDQVSLNPRRSSRVRTKPLEYWNFEKVEVMQQQDGEVKVLHHKQGSDMSIQTKVVDCTGLALHTGQGITISDDLLRDTTEPVTRNTKAGKPTPKRAVTTLTHPALSVLQGRHRASGSAGTSLSKSPGRRKLFSQGDNYYQEPVEETRASKIRVGGMTLTMVGRVKFSDLQFVVLEKKDYRCYLAHSLKDKRRNFVVSYLFLERGHIVMHTKMKWVIYVMEGCGMLRILRDGIGTSHPMKPKFTIDCATGSKLCLRKDGRCKMLKLHLCLFNDEDDGDEPAPWMG